MSFKDGTSLQNSPFSFDPETKLFSINSNGPADATTTPHELRITVSFPDAPSDAASDTPAERVDDSTCVQSACLEGG